MKRGCISLIVPSLNVVDYIEECIQSVINQTLQDIEIICVDAGSTDGTYEILQNYACHDERIKLIHSDKRSYGYQMNLGIKVARGDYIGIVETDDFIVPEMFDKLYKIAKRYNVDFVKSGYISFWGDKDNRVECTNINVKPRDTWNQKLELDKNIEYRLADINHIWSGIYRKQFLLENELWFNETPGASFQDTSFSVLVGMTAKTCIYLNDCFYHYRIDRAESSVKSDAKYRCVVDEFQYIEKYIKQHRLSTVANMKQVRSVQLDVYQWNMCRLTDESQVLFMQSIEGEMQNFLPHGDFYDELNHKQKQQVMLLTDFDYLKEYEKREDDEKIQFESIVKRGLSIGGYVFVGAGQYFQKFIAIQELCGQQIVRAVCDNSNSLQGSLLSEYKVLSVEDAVGRYREYEWLIANKYHADEIESQLLLLGVREEKIIKLNSVPELIEVYSMIKQNRMTMGF